MDSKGRKEDRDKERKEEREKTTCQQVQYGLIEKIYMYTVSYNATPK